MKIWREDGELVVQFGNNKNYTRHYYPLDEPFFLARLGDVLIGIDMIFTLYFIWPQLAANSRGGEPWGVVLPLGVWALLIGFLLSGYALRFLIAPHIRNLRAKKAMEKMKKNLTREMTYEGGGEKNED
jgi:hypothetical protein